MKKKLTHVIWLFICFLYSVILSGQTVTLNTNATMIGDNIIVSWSGFSGNVNIKFYKGSTFITYPNTNVSGNGQQTLTMTDAAIGNGYHLSVGNDYKVVVELRSNTAVYATSNSFSVSNPVVSITPTSADYGGVVMLNWSGFSNNVNLLFYKGTDFITYANTDVSGAGLQTLNLTDEALGNQYHLTQGSDYFVKVELRANTKISSNSNYFSLNQIIDYGNLVVTINPSQAILAGAQWNIDGGAWQKGGTTLNKITTGSHIINFKTIPGWTTPSSKIINIIANQTIVESGIYTLAPPATPSGLTLNQISGGFSINWNTVKGVDGPYPYKIYWGTDNSVSESNYSGIIMENAPPSNHSGLINGSTYYYRIKACNDSLSLCSPLSSVISKSFLSSTSKTFRCSASEGFRRVIGTSGGQCPVYVRNETDINCSGDAHKWLQNALNAGYVVGDCPKPSSIVVFGISDGMKYGHVAIVKAVTDNNKIILRHSNWHLDEKISEEEINISDYPNIIGFIYCDGLNECGGNVGSETIKTDDNLSVNVYPNPVTDELTFELKNYKCKIYFEIVNTYGQVVKKGFLNEKTTICTTDFSAGLYTIKFDDGKRLEYRKIVKQ